MEKITTVGIDLAKRVFALHGVDGSGRAMLKKTVRREQLVELVASLPPCVIGMEACSGAHAWARQFQGFGHEVKLMAPAFVVPYRKSGKNDGNDAEAICEAVQRPNMRFVPVKSAEQQGLLALHRVRQGWIEERTATINRMRALLTEFGVVLPNRAPHVRRNALAAGERLPALARRALEDLRSQLALLDERIGAYDRELEAQAQASEPAQRLMKIRGIGPITAVAIVATVGNARDFKSGRQFAAWLGLTPRQHSSGGRSRLGRITRRGDAYLRCLLVQGARSVLHTAIRHSDRMSRWILNLQGRRGYHKTLVAIAAKNARIAWALLSKGQELKMAA
jgi:transposase